MRGERVLIPLKAGHHRLFAGGPIISGLVALRFSRGSGPVLLRNPIFRDFQGGGSPLSPSLDLPMASVLLK